MPSLDHLQLAVDKGLLSQSQVQPLKAFLDEVAWSNASAAEQEVAEAEEVHFARGFHDIFISTGLVILVVGYLVGMSVIFDELISFPVFAGLMVLTWGLAEWFTKRLMLALPSILLTGAFVVASAITVDTALEFLAGAGHSSLAKSQGSGADVGWTNSLAFLFSMLAGWIFYKRFQVPITPAFLLVSLLGFVLATIAAIDHTLLTDYLPFWLLGIGIICFGSAMRFDMRDPLRKTLDSDKAFWMHLVAAPLIVHALLSTLGALGESNLTALAIIVMVAALGFVALVIDRRAILASALGYLGVAIGTLLQEINLDEAGTIAITLLALGIFVLMLGSGWPYLRRMVLKPLSGHRLLQVVPPVKA